MNNNQLESARKRFFQAVTKRKTAQKGLEDARKELVEARNEENNAKKEYQECALQQQAADRKSAETSLNRLAARFEDDLAGGGGQQCGVGESASGAGAGGAGAGESAGGAGGIRSVPLFTPLATAPDHQSSDAADPVQALVSSTNVTVSAAIVFCGGLLRQAYENEHLTQFLNVVRAIGWVAATKAHPLLRDNPAGMIVAFCWDTRLTAKTVGVMAQAMRAEDAPYVLVAALLAAANLLTRADIADERFVRAKKERATRRLPREPRLRRFPVELAFRLKCFSLAAAMLSLTKSAAATAKTPELMLFAYAVAGRTQLAHQGQLFLAKGALNTPGFDEACDAVRPTARRCF